MPAEPASIVHSLDGDPLDSNNTPAYMPKPDNKFPKKAAAFLGSGLGILVVIAGILFFLLVLPAQKTWGSVCFVAGKSPRLYDMDDVLGLP